MKKRDTRRKREKKAAVSFCFNPVVVGWGQFGGAEKEKKKKKE